MANTLEAVFGLNGKVAIVTGAARGIGRGTAEMLAGCGAKVVVADRDAENGKRVADGIVKSGGAAIFIQYEQSDEASIIALFQKAADAYGAPDILVNNAAMIGMLPMLEMPTDFWDRMLTVNPRGAYLCMREAVKRMRAAGRGGRIINLSSAASLHATVDGAIAYSASKGAINALTHAAAREFGPDKILINAVLPDAIAHADARAQFIEHNIPVPSGGPSQDIKRRPIGRVGTPDDIAAVVTFLAGPGGSFISGQSILVDGGFSAG
jgi:NAD(P)-dependent dehydrogenase (short-subunit alcohol dehydrogenase family)